MSTSKLRLAPEALTTSKVLDERQESFLDWLLTPEVMREPRTMEGYSQESGVPYSTLKRWKGNTAFRAAYDKKVRSDIANPERVQRMADMAYERASDPNNRDNIKWAALWAQMAGLTKVEPGLQKTGTEALADLTDEELKAVLAEAAQGEARRRAADA